MTKKKKKAPNTSVDNNTLIDNFDYLGNAASSHDCTGLIPSAPNIDEELEAYEKIYHYLPPNGDVVK